VSVCGKRSFSFQKRLSVDMCCIAALLSREKERKRNRVCVCFSPVCFTVRQREGECYVAVLKGGFTFYCSGISQAHTECFLVV
jgi:hypothetical protein